MIAFVASIMTNGLGPQLASYTVLKERVCWEGAGGRWRFDLVQGKRGKKGGRGFAWDGCYDFEEGVGV